MNVTKRKIIDRSKTILAILAVFLMCLPGFGRAVEDSERYMPDPYAPASEVYAPIGEFGWPLETAGLVTSGFGEREDPISGEIALHHGIDIAMPEGTPILAAAAGTVVFVNDDATLSDYGIYIRILHEDGSATLYAHCSALVPLRGDPVEKGQEIAFVGSTGKATGAHLHFEIVEGGESLDPMEYFELRDPLLVLESANGAPDEPPQSTLTPPNELSRLAAESLGPETEPVVGNGHLRMQLS